MNFADRTYPDVVRDLLTVLTGGTVQETIEIGATPPEAIALVNGPVRRVSHLAGSVLAGRGDAQRAVPYRFTEKDFDLIATPENPVDKVAIKLRKPHRLAPFSTLVVNYYPERLRPTPITDVNVGSVARTLIETVSRELATQYQQLQIVYESAFVDTATGASLDNVAALVDVRRIVRGAPVGKVRFTRATGSPGQVFIPIDSVVTDGQGSRYLTTVEGTLLPNQGSVDIWVHGETPRTKVMDAGTLTVLERAIAGIAAIGNDEATWLATDDETDRQLSDRTRRAIHSTGTGTVDAICFGLESLPFVTAASMAEYPDPAVAMPGQLLVSVALSLDTPTNRQIVDRRIDELRPAGIFVDRRWAGSVKLAVAVDLVFAGARLSSGEQEAVKEGVRSALVTRIGSMAPGSTLRQGPLTALALQDGRLVDAKLAWTADGVAIADGFTIAADKAARLDRADVTYRSALFETQESGTGPVTVQVDVQGKLKNLTLSVEGAQSAIRTRLQQLIEGLTGGATIAFDAVVSSLRNDAAYVLDLETLVVVLEPEGAAFAELRLGTPGWVSPPTAGFKVRNVLVEAAP